MADVAKPMIDVDTTMAELRKMTIRERRDLLVSEELIREVQRRTLLLAAERLRVMGFKGIAFDVEAMTHEL